MGPKLESCSTANGFRYSITSSLPQARVLPSARGDPRASECLGVRSVLEGSIRRAGNRVRITAQLIDATNGAHLWTDRYDRDLTDIFEVQDDVTRRIVDSLKITLSPAEKARLADSGTPNIDAYDCYLRGRELLAVHPSYWSYSDLFTNSRNGRIRSRARYRFTSNYGTATISTFAGSSRPRRAW
jgi:hypothetical protein